MMASWLIKVLVCLAHLMIELTQNSGCFTICCQGLEMWFPIHVPFAYLVDQIIRTHSLNGEKNVNLLWHTIASHQH